MAAGNTNYEAIRDEFQHKYYSKPWYKRLEAKYTGYKGGTQDLPSYNLDGRLDDWIRQIGKQAGYDLNDGLTSDTDYDYD